MLGILGCEGDAGKLLFGENEGCRIVRKVLNGDGICCKGGGGYVSLWLIGGCGYPIVGDPIEGLAIVGIVAD